MLVVMILTVAATGVLFVQIPKGLFPQEDSGLIMGIAQATPDISPPCRQKCGGSATSS